MHSHPFHPDLCSLISPICRDLFFFFLLSGFEQIEAADYLNAIGAMWAAYTQTFISVSCPCLDLAGANKWVFKSRRWDMGLHTQQVPLCSANTWHHFWLLLFCCFFCWVCGWYWILVVIWNVSIIIITSIRISIIKAYASFSTPFRFLFAIFSYIFLSFH